MTRSKLALLSAAPLLLLLTACGGGGNGPTGSAGSTLTLDLGADSTPDWSKVVLGVQEVDVSSDGTNWTALSTPKKTFDLNQIQNGGLINIASNAPISPGTYQVRITWATTNYADGALQPAYVYPVGSSTGSALTMPVTSKVPGTISVSSNGTNSAFVMLDTASAVQSFTSGSAKILFQPSAVLFDSTSASITGTVMDGSAHAIAGAEVFAEVIDGTLTPHVMRRAFTNASGAYQLDGLDTSGGESYFIVAMPAASSTTAYPPGAMGAFTPTAGQVVDAGAMAFSASPVSTGGIALTLTPQTPSGQGTFANLQQNILIGGVSYPLIFRADAVITGTSSDTYTFAKLPATAFGVSATRFVPGGAVTATGAASSVVTVTGGTTAPVSFTM